MPYRHCQGDWGFECLELYSDLISDLVKVMSWWDYGYQITAMANRTIIVDNNTWNNTHISRVGQAMASPEDKAYEIMRELDVNYVLVIFGGLTGYSSDGQFQPETSSALS